MVRDSGVAAASEKYFDRVQPPSEISTRSFGLAFLSSASWLRLPAIGWPATSATPSTLFSAVNEVCQSAHGSAEAQTPAAVTSLNA